MDWILGIGITGLVVCIGIFVIPYFANMIYEACVFLADKIRYR